MIDSIHSRLRSLTIKRIRSQINVLCIKLQLNFLFLFPHQKSISTYIHIKFNFQTQFHYEMSKPFQDIQKEVDPTRLLVFLFYVSNGKYKRKLHLTQISGQFISCFSLLSHFGAVNFEVQLHLIFFPSDRRDMHNFLSGEEIKSPL